MSNKLADYGKSLELANQINELKKVALAMDLEYMLVAAEEMIGRARWQDAAIVLNPSYPLEKNDLIRLQGEALKKLHEFVEMLKRCEEGKEKVRQVEQSQSDIMKMFM